MFAGVSITMNGFLSETFEILKLQNFEGLQNFDPTSRRSKFEPAESATENFSRGSIEVTHIRKVRATHKNS